jgi:hypothetical protein
VHAHTLLYIGYTDTNVLAVPAATLAITALSQELHVS